MTTHPRLLSAAALLSLAAAAAGDPPVGGVLLLDNQQVIQGQVERVGDQYRVRREGGETLVPAARVAAACADLEAAYRFLRDRSDRRDADARLRLARWCDANGLRAQAAAEAKAAAELAPRRAVVQAVYQQFQRKADAPALRPAEPAKLPASILSGEPTAGGEVEPVECSPEAIKRFATKVQPLLMNACAGCHAGEKAGKFRLERVYADSLNTRPATQYNLAATLAVIDREKPAGSPLLQRATAAHGGAALPPLRDRGVPAFKQLDEWVKLVLSDDAPQPEPAPAATGSGT